MPELEVVTEVAVALATPASAEEGVLFIGTQFSNLSTAVDTSAAAAWCVFFFSFFWRPRMKGFFGNPD